METAAIYSNKSLFNHFAKTLAKLSKGNGSIITIAGDTGFGKTLILEEFEKQAASDKNALWALTHAANPIGKIKVGNLQPLLPFSKALEKLGDNPNLTAEKRFAMSVGMTLLASIPLIDSVFYAAKEIGKDWRSLQKEKSSAALSKLSTATADYYDAIRAYCDKSPIVLLMDDMQWADAQSVELLNVLADNISSIPLLIVLAYKPSLLEASALPFLSFLNHTKEKKNQSVVSFELESFNAGQISEIANDFLPNYVSNSNFERWLSTKTQGMPLSVISYLKFFSSNSPFDNQGNFDPNHLKQSALPASIQSLISENMGQLSNDDRNILAVCSAEGSEFTISIVSKLLNLDVLSTIKKLRAIQNSTNIIFSQGASLKYGEKTTVYKFSQAYYHTYFEKTLEYEEYTALHSQISLILKDKYNQTKLADVKEQLAPYIAAHSAEAGDTETAETMLFASAESAVKFGSPDILNDLYSEYIHIAKTTGVGDQDANFERLMHETQGGEGTGTAAGQANGGMNAVNGNPEFFNQGIFDFKAFIMNISKEFIDGDYDSALQHIRDIKDNYSESLREDEAIRLELIESKIMLEVDDLGNTKRLLDRIEPRLNNLQDNELVCLYHNMRGILESNEANYESAKYHLGLAATSAVELSPELRLLTISNISIVLKENSEKSANKYLASAKKLAYSLNMQDFLVDLDNAIEA